MVLSHLRYRRELREAGRRYREFGMRKPRYGLVRHAEVAGRGKGAPRLDGAGGTAELEADPRYSHLPEGLRGGLLEWPEKGYLIAEGFFDREAVAAINDEIDALSESGSIRAHHRDPRFMSPHKKSPAAARVVSDARLTELLEILLGRPVRLFQTIAFISGSQQHAHSDAFHMMTEPPGFLVGVWIALEDIDEGSGPVFYLPGSHRLPYVMSEDLNLNPASRLMTRQKDAAYVQHMQEIVDGAEIEPRRFLAKAGDVLLWHHNLLHGGTAIERPGATRRSLVAHFFAEDVLCYHEVAERPALLPV